MSTEELTLIHEDRDDRGGFYFRTPGCVTLGEIEYKKEDFPVLDFHHTWVDKSLRGQGRAGQLLDAAMAWARETKHTVRPTCPYVVKQFEENESLHDLYAADFKRSD